MKKRVAIIAVAVVGLIAAAGSSAYLGRTLTQQAFDSQIAELKSAAPLYLLTLQQSRLEHSLFGGKSSIELLFEPPEADMTPFFLVIESQLQYGPLLSTAQGFRLGLASGQSQLLVKGLPDSDAKRLEALIGPYLLTAHHHVDFSQRLQGKLATPALQLAHNGDKLAFDGIQASFSSQLDSGQTQGQLTLGSLTVESPHGALQSHAAHGQFNYSDIGDMLASGRFSLNFPEIDIRQPNASVTLKGFGIDLEQAPLNGKLNVTETIKVEQIIGPVPVTALSARFDIEQINPQGIKLWTQMLGQAGSKDPLTGLPDIDQTQLRELVSSLLQPGLTFNQRYDIDAMDGNLQANLKMEYVGLADGLHLMDLQQPHRLLEAINTSLQIEVDRQIAMTLPIAPALPQYIEQGFVTQSSDKQKLSVKATLIDGQLTVNGLPIPLDGLLPEKLAMQ